MTDSDNPPEDEESPDEEPAETPAEAEASGEESTESPADGEGSAESSSEAESSGEDSDGSADEEPSGGDADETDEEPPIRGFADATPDGLRADPRVLPYVPPPTRVLGALSVAVWIYIAHRALRSVAHILIDYWFLKSIGLESMFWTNVQAAAILFVVAAIPFALAIYLPMRLYAKSPFLRWFAKHLAAWGGIAGGWWAASHYLQYLLAFAGGSFGTTDPVFGNDVGFYVFTLPAVWTTMTLLTTFAAVGLLASLLAQADRLRAEGGIWRRGKGVSELLAPFATPAVQVFVGALGVFLSIDLFLARYEILWKNNIGSGLPMGPENIDFSPLFSTVNMLQVTSLVVLGITILAVYQLRGLYAHHSDADSSGGLGFRRSVAMGMAGLLVLDIVFASGLVLTDELLVQPNEPQSQEPFIEDHIDTTLDAYQLDEMETVSWEQPSRGEPLESETLLASQTVQRAPIVPGWVTYLDAPVDLTHLQRYRETGTTRVYGPTLQVYNQEQTLRPYYHIPDVATTRYEIDGEKRVYVSATRELPPARVAIGDQPLTWGTRRFLYTHGHGLVMSPADEVSPDGDIQYTVRDIPQQSDHPELDSEPRIYYGRSYGGPGLKYIFTNARGISELDYATDQGRQVYRYDEVGHGIPMDSYTKRLTLSYNTRDWSILFSNLIDHDRTRVHYYRDPMKRIDHVAPFLFADCNIYPVAVDGRTKWIMNALTTTKEYPNSQRKVLGDKAEERCEGEGQTRGNQRMINYAEDSVKVTVDAKTGEMEFYKVADKPIVNAWSRVYPDLFSDRSEMPEDVESHLQYPIQWMHIQFDDIYKRYHQVDGVEFYNNEDVWDDADEVRGAIFQEREEIVFSYEPTDMLLDPDDLQVDSGVSGDDMKFVKVMPFTPERRENLRSMVVVYQDPENYGQAVSYQVPQGEFVHGPEQADALIDQNASINQQIRLWKRQGSEVIRGHTLTLPVEGDILYLEPIWVKSQQNEQPEIRLFAAVYRGQVAFASSPEGAIRNLDGVSPANATAGTGGESP